MTPVLFGWPPAEPAYSSSAPGWASVSSTSIRQPALANPLDWFASSGEAATLLTASDSNAVQESLPLQAHTNASGADTSQKEPLQRAASVQGHDSSALDNDRPNVDEVSRHPTGSGSRYTTELKLIKNREAQKRFRQRHKARSHDVEAQLAATTAELEELRFKQQQLEARNVLLEKISYLSSRKSASQDEATKAVRPAHS